MYLQEQHSESFKVLSAIIRINAEWKFLIMKSSLEDIYVGLTSVVNVLNIVQRNRTPDDGCIVFVWREILITQSQLQWKCNNARFLSHRMHASL